MLFIPLGVGESNKNLSRNKFTQVVQVLFLPLPTLSQTWLSGQSFRTQAPKVSSPTEHPLKVTIPSMCHDEWCQLQSYCLEHRAKLHCLPVFCSLLTHVKAKGATPWKGFYWQPEGRQVMQVMKGARYLFASSTQPCRQASNCKSSKHKYNLTFQWRLTFQ